MSKAAAGEQVRQTRSQTRIRGGIRIVVLGRFLQGLRADEGGEVGVFAVNQRHKAVFRQFRFTAIADGDLGRALHVHAAVIAREGVARQVFHRPAGLHAANRGAPAVLFEGAVDVGRHRIGGVRPRIAVVVCAVGLLFKVKAVHRVGANTVRQTRQEARHHQTEIAGIFRLTQ